MNDRNASFFYFCFASLLFWTSILQLHATERRPWFGPDKLPEWRTTYTYLHTSKIHSDLQNLAIASDSQFIDMGLAVSPIPILSFEAEIQGADTQLRTFGLDQIVLTGRYLVLDDVSASAPVSLALGASYVHASRQAIRDPFCFHHGINEWVAHASVGKEWVCSNFWSHRGWGYVGIGNGGKGFPWIRSILGWDWNRWDLDQLSIYLEGLWGLGSDSFDLTGFQNYARIKHRSLDIGCSWTHWWEKNGSLTLGYAFRPYARNFPANGHAIELKLYIPFGL